MRVYNTYDDTDITAAIAALAVLLVLLQDAVDDVQTDVTTILALVTIIEAVTSALPTLSETGGTVTTDGTEQNVYINAAPLGVFNPICVKIDCSAHTATETIVIREYYDVAPGGAGLLLADTLTFIGVIAPVIITIDLDPNRYGVAVTIEKTGGTNRAYPWEVLYEI